MYQKRENYGGSRGTIVGSVRHPKLELLRFKEPLDNSPSKGNEKESFPRYYVPHGDYEYF